MKKRINSFSASWRPAFSPKKAEPFPNLSYLFPTYYDEQGMKRKRSSVWIILLGIGVIFAFVFVARGNYIARDIRTNGKLIYAPITQINRAPNGGFYVRINDKQYYAGTWIKRKDGGIGDIIAVRYLEKEYTFYFAHRLRVIPERVEIWRINMWLGLSSLLLLAGIFLIIAGFHRPSVRRKTLNINNIG